MGPESGAGGSGSREKKPDSGAGEKKPDSGAGGSGSGEKKPGSGGSAVGEKKLEPVAGEFTVQGDYDALIGTNSRLKAQFLEECTAAVSRSKAFCKDVQPGPLRSLVIYLGGNKV